VRISRVLRRIVGIGLCLSVVAISPARAAHHRAHSPATSAPAIYVGARKVRVAAYIDHGRVLVPVRGVFEAIGASVSYSAPHFVVVRRDGMVLAAFILGRMHAITGERSVALESPAVRRDGRIYVPLRVVAEAAGATVVFKDNPPVVHIAQGAATVGSADASIAAPARGEPADRDVTAEASPDHWRIGIALATALCCLGCLVITARRFAPTLMRPAAAKRASALAGDPVAPVLPPADVVALSSVQTTGEARFHKQIVRETRTIAVPITREELIIEYAGDGGTVIIQGRTLEAGETVRIPLWEERVHVDVTKHVILKEDIVIDKRRIVAAAPPGAREEMPDPLDAAEGSPS
jgi:uncharacterized protein (TIGR02271 family)